MERDEADPGNKGIEEVYRSVRSVGDSSRWLLSFELPILLQQVFRVGRWKVGLEKSFKRSYP